MTHDTPMKKYTNYEFALPSLNSLDAYMKI